MFESALRSALPRDRIDVAGGGRLRRGRCVGRGCQREPDGRPPSLARRAGAAAVSLGDLVDQCKPDAHASGVP
jgi:hypothetical protein